MDQYLDNDAWTATNSAAQHISNLSTAKRHGAKKVINPASQESNKEDNDRDGEEHYKESENDYEIGHDDLVFKSFGFLITPHTHHELSMTVMITHVLVRWSSG